MKIKFALLLVVFTCVNIFAQVDNQKRLQSDVRKYYVWNNDEKKYELMETEYEHSIIDIREIGSKTNGYIVISMLDNGLTRLHHGSIYNYSQTSENEGTWLFKSKTSKAKMTYNPQDNTITYLYDADNNRYRRLLIFNVVPDELPESSLRTIVKVD
ncbi:hypothetical protein [Flavobacterium capsici]|uniref:Uncharacterized protein n=1 Tax=Flavobacterium capsici TaxID=3075618 RepID=A0AA96J7X8_9FLAO|nr:MULTISPECIES: hypothetical protein [unclassified Flavobacterium]WNM18779.1 hypothetical protein RN608_12275 [Flavobacterium sp. PMR2A8]WNM22830.1 hypothetical protein RN605_05575 [Flavobacterium sp. PMTSA4]